ncbi:MAG: MBG domain-containing protein [Verrucomicrobiota bacterium]
MRNILAHSNDKKGAKLKAACFLLSATAAGLHAGEIRLREMEAVYDGRLKTPSAVTIPEGLSHAFYYRDRSLPPELPLPEVIYKNRPDDLALSYFSLSLANEKILLVGNVIHPGGTARELESCQTTLVTWARAKDYPALAAANPAGYHHPVTMSLFRVTEANQIVPLISQTLPILVPWRPETLPGGGPYNFNGCAFRVGFFFPAGVLLPERLMVAVGFSTSKAGNPKMPAPGPYDVLNVALHSFRTDIGEDENPTDSYINKAGTWSSVTWNSLNAPMIKLVAKSFPGETMEPPVRAGSYDVRAVITAPDESAQTKGIFVVHKAPADITLTNPDRPNTGVSWLVGVGGKPAEVPVAVTYNDSPDVPAQPGVYHVEATVTDPNYVGSATAVVRIGDQFDAWISRVGGASDLAEESRPPDADPDHDGLPNLLEYAFARNPALPDTGEDRGVTLAATEAGLSLSWRENPNAVDLTFTVERTTTPEQAASWTRVTPLQLTVVSETETVRVVKTLLPPAAAGQMHEFFRVRVSH